MATWQKFEITIPGKDVLEPVRNVLQTLLVFLEILKAILETVKIFLIAFPNPIKALVEALIKLIMQLFEALMQTGVYGYFDVPVPDIDPNFKRQIGGSTAFVNRFKASLLDRKDPNRPQPVPLFDKSAFVLLMVDASSIVRLLNMIAILLRFFGREFSSPRYPAPANVKVLPVGSKNDPILAVAKLFSSEIKAVAVEWSTSTTVRYSDPGFNSLVPELATEFIPPKFLVERSEINPNQKIDADALSDDATGVITYSRESTFESRGKKALRRETLFDLNREPVVKFQKYFVVDPFSTTGILGQLGRFRWIDSNVEVDKIYYYRVRAFSGDLAVSSDRINFADGIKDVPGSNSGIKRFEWPGSAVTMGRSSGLLTIRVPKTHGAKFNVIDNLYRLFLVAFSLDFHEDITSHVIKPKFDSEGMPVGGTLNTDVGKGSLQANAGIIAAFKASDIAFSVSTPESLSKNYQPNPVTGAYPTMPWDKTGVQHSAARLANNVGPAMLQAGYSFTDTFRKMMQDPPPKSWDVGDWKNIETAVDYLTGSASFFSDTVEQITGSTSSKGEGAEFRAATYGKVYFSVNYRLNILSVVNFIKSFTLGGTGADWVKLSILRDIIPWSGDLIYKLLDYIQALLDAFNGTMKEISDFIDLLIRKINALEKFIKFLIRIMEYIMSLSVEVYMLKSDSMTGGIEKWFEQVDNADGEKPPTSPVGYSAGVVLAYVTPDDAGIKTAFDIIF